MSEPTTRWWQGQMTVCWHPESPGSTIYVWRSWWRKRRPFASLREVQRYYRPDFHATAHSGRCSTCNGTGLVPFGLPSNGPDPCPDCAGVEK